MHRRHAGFVLAALAFSLPGLASAQTYPDKPIRLIVPYPPGASTDALGRLVGQKVSASIGQPVVVDNRGGASGNIGTEAVAKSPPDGYTFGLGTDATHAANTHLVANPPFQPLRDFTPLALAAMNPIVLVVHPSVPASNLQELIAYVKANKDKAGFGSSGTGSPHHLAGELLRSRTGAPFTHVPYRGGGPALNDLIGGQIPMLFASAITVIPHIQGGRAKAIAITSAARWEKMPNVPTIAETLEGFDVPSWLAFFGPANLPAPIASRLSGEIVKALNDPEVKAKLTESGLIVVGGGPRELADMQRKDYELKGRIIRDAGVKAD
ncbi:Bug family tripartite tricarboxylate transporter substrate binding protein [Ramlibacter henchirensis]|nr:tripartite tricarboxylate transporter substrate binding protein [Ramlibacter henchirensis]